MNDLINFSRLWRRTLIITALLVFGLTSARADVAVAWNEALETAVASSPPKAPHLEARAFALAHLAIDEAIATARGEASSFRDIITAQRAAASAAACIVLTEVWPAAKAQFESLYHRQIGALPASSEVERATRLGRMAAAVVLQKRAGDGWSALGVFYSRPDPSENAGRAVAAGEPMSASPWRSARPFFLKNVAHFEAIPPTELTFEGRVRRNYAVQNPRFFKDVDRSGSPEALLRTWSENPIATWNRVARTIAATSQPDLAAEARLLTVLNVALADAIVAAEHSRFTLGSWRAMTIEALEPSGDGAEISAVIDGVSGSAHLKWGHRRALLPPLLNYPSLRATIAGAAQAALTACCKSDRIGFTLAAPFGSDAAPRSFASLAEASREAAFVAALDGRHVREACVAGHELGVSVGNYVAKRAASRR